MTKYTKTINKKVVIKERNRIVIKKDGMQIFNPTDEMLQEDGWVEYIVEKTEKQLLEEAKQEKIQELKMEDRTKTIIVDDIDVWFDKNERTNLLARFSAEKFLGKTETVIWYRDTKFTMSVDEALELVYTMEGYSAECFDLLQEDIININNFSNKNDVDNYMPKKRPEKKNIKSNKNA